MEVQEEFFGKERAFFLLFEIGNITLTANKDLYTLINIITH